MGDGAAEALVHREALVAPVARGAQTAELAGNRAARLRLPFPDVLQERLAADLGALDALAVEVAFDHHLGGDAGMVGSDHPQGVLAAHPLATGEDVLQRVVERMADVQRAGDVGRRHDDRPRRRVGPVGPEQPAALPMRVPARLDACGIEGLGKLAHSAAVSDAALQHQPAASGPGRYGPTSLSLLSGCWIFCGGPGASSSALAILLSQP